MIHENVFHDLMESSNLLELADKFEVFLKYMKSQHNDNKLYEAFYKELLFFHFFLQRAISSISKTKILPRPTCLVIGFYVTQV